MISRREATENKVKTRKINHKSTPLLHGVDLLFCVSSLGIALNKGVVRNLSILSIVNSWAAQVLLTLSFLRLPRKRDLFLDEDAGIDGDDIVTIGQQGIDVDLLDLGGEAE